MMETISADQLTSPGKTGAQASQQAFSTACLAASFPPPFSPTFWDLPISPHAHGPAQILFLLQASLHVLPGDLVSQEEGYYLPTPFMSWAQEH